MAPLILYHFPPSAPSRAALLAVRNLNLDVEIKEIDLFNKKQLDSEYIKINPQHTVPAIDDNGFYLWESRAISQYLVETKNPASTLYPKDPKEKALVNQRLYFDLGTLYTRVRAICYPVLFMGETIISEEKKERLYEAFDFMEKFLDGKKWFCGDKVTIADLSILASLSSIVYVGGKLKNYPRLSAWYEQCKTLPGFEENDKGAKYYGELVCSKLKENNL